MIYYFSATGNCRYVAERIAHELRTEAVSITNCSLQITTTADEVLGFIFPTYFWGLPSYVDDFLKAVTFSGEAPAYTFVLATYGTTTGQADRFAADLLEAKGLRIDARFSVKMPDTWTVMYDLSDPEKAAEINFRADLELNNVIRRIIVRNKGDYNHAKQPMFAAKAAGLFYDGSRKTSHLHVSDDCIGCSLCEKNCPVDAIEMEDDKPVWVIEKCAMCLGCLHRCPEFAIQYDNRTKKHGQYQHPPFKKQKT